MAKAVYDIPGMKNAASRIRDKMEQFDNSKKTMNNTVDSTNNFFQDERQKKYIQKYQELKNTMDSVEECMKKYAEFLEAAARKFDQDQHQGI